MFLKSIEIRGFKSFADKTELSFKKGVTAVVGPNGSGKSNISDAIRWVLGEQSVKSLRGGKMEDVIFAGTQYRKPVGLAQVCLTLDNSSGELPIDYSDVNISRRLYRSGESEYFINNTPCRLRDVHELFMDTGIGKEGYSIIGQGKIDAILSGRPEERRALLEEAAGIVKFKSRKDEAQKKLDLTEQNLVRINDIISTYEERLEPLRIDNEKAKEFLDLSSKLKDLEVSLIVKRLTAINESISKQRMSLEEISNEIQCLQIDQKEVKGFLIKQENLLDNYENQNKVDKEQYYKIKETIQRLQSQIQITEERCINSNKSIEANKKEIATLQNKLNVFEEEKINNEEKLVENQNNQSKLKEEIVNSEEHIKNLNEEFLELKKEINTLREDAIEILRDISEFKNQRSRIENDIDSLKVKKQQLKDYCDNYKNSLSINNTTSIMLIKEKDKFQYNIKNLEGDIKENKKQLIKLRNEINDLEVKIKEKSRSVTKLEANRNALINLENNYEGYNKSVKTLMSRIKKRELNIDSDKCWVLGDVINVSSDNEVAIEIALGGGISDIITDNENQAKYLIEYLKRNNLGRATFLPLNIIQGKEIALNNDIKSIEGYVGIASEIISFPDKFKNAIDYLLGRTIICKDMDSALKVAKRVNYKYKIVTLQGEVLNTGGALTGGSIYYKNTNIIGRKREIEQLKTDIEEHNIIIEKLNLQLINSKETYKDIDDNCLKLKDEIHYNYLEIAKIEEKILAMNSERERLNKSIATSEEEMALIEENINLNHEALKKKNEYISNLNKKDKESQDRIKWIEEYIKDKEEDLKGKKDRLTELKIRKAHIDEVVSNKIKDLIRISKDLEEVSSKLLEIKSAIIQEEEALSKGEKDIDLLKKKINEHENKGETLKETFQSYETESIKIKKDISNLKAKIEEFQLLIQKKEDEKNKVNLNKTRLEIEEENLYEELNNQFSLSFVEALDLAREIKNESSVKQEIFELKKSVSNLGTVNLGAIEEYEEVKEKYGFMSNQREDLNEAKDELIEVINDMIKKMKEVFTSNFKVLRENFNETFRELFKGGSADLILGEGDELTANIEINVQPPGKKLQNINLMSGGEKVLSAIALLFAILKMKPTPFCILDEIEAALDDANVYRYAEFLKEFSSNIQFIVITHRKGTMEASDMLYGVTMEERGISKIVSVDLSA
ncbi:chromosome segregation protein SMC [Clostridium sp. MSJ-4]|uniref:Chromosome partition protein Smc n=1 Tax=Clostridium simiarum TaxID=2841506 RepID=A0ABS6EYW3_9CLOT|nr:chromosome segregation protein SMC [Clostridium simiarum]MBU5590844.1 chromosome segregation protein SMC [Clostridium simiarum]